MYIVLPKLNSSCVIASAQSHFTSSLMRFDISFMLTKSNLRAVKVLFYLPFFSEKKKAKLIHTASVQEDLQFLSKSDLLLHFDTLPVVKYSTSASFIICALICATTVFGQLLMRSTSTFKWISLLRSRQLSMILSEVSHPSLVLENGEAKSLLLMDATLGN